MSHDDSLRALAQNLLKNHPQAQNPTDQQIKDHHDRQTIQNEMDRIRKENDSKRS